MMDYFHDFFDLTFAISPSFALATAENPDPPAPDLQLFSMPRGS